MEQPQESKEAIQKRRDDLAAARAKQKAAGENIATRVGGRKRSFGKTVRAARKANRKVRQAKRKLRQEKRRRKYQDKTTENTSLSPEGPSFEERLFTQTENARNRQEAMYGQVRPQLQGNVDTNVARAAGLDQQYGQSYGTAQQGLGTLQNAVNAIGGAATQSNEMLGKAADANILANQQNMRDQTNFAQGQLGRQAMGVASGQGEGGALAAQSALAGLAQAGGQMATQGNLQLANLAADTRNQTALAQANRVYQAAGDTATAQTNYQNAAQNMVNAAGEMSNKGQDLAQTGLGQLTKADLEQAAQARETEMGAIQARAGLAAEKQKANPMPLGMRLGF